MLFWEVIAVYSENHTKSIYTLCGQTAKLLNIKTGGTYTYQNTHRFQSNNLIISLYILNKSLGLAVLKFHVLFLVRHLHISFVNLSFTSVISQSRSYFRQLFSVSVNQIVS